MDLLLKALNAKPLLIFFLIRCLMLMMACDKAYVLGTCLPPSNMVLLLPQVHVLELVKHRHSPLHLSGCSVPPVA